MRADSYLLGSATTSVTFSVPSCDFFCSSSQQNGNYISDTLTQSGVPQTGQYTLVVDANANGPNYFSSPPVGTASAQLTLTPVPLPASGGLLALGLVPLMLLWLRGKAI
jgi:hypothetical protein